MSATGNPTTAAHESPGARALKRFWRRGATRIAATVLTIVTLSAVFAPWLAPYDPAHIDLFNTLSAPSAEHWLGTDENGRDILSRLLHGGRVSIAVGLAAMFAAIFIGTLLGALAGYLGGWVDSIISRLIDGFLSIPMFFFLLTTLSIFGSSLPVLITAIALTNWMQVARIVRGEVLANTQKQFVESANALGLTRMKTLFRHVLPQSVPSIIVAATLGVAYAILTESALSYLGIGVRPPTPSWGNMLADARGYIWQSPLLTVWPGLLIFFTVLSFNSLGDSLRDATDPT